MNNKYEIILKAGLSLKEVKHLNHRLKWLGIPKKAYITKLIQNDLKTFPMPKEEDNEDHPFTITNNN